MTRVIGDTGSHKEDSKIEHLSRWIELAEADVDNFKERIESLNKDLEDLTKKFDDGDLSRNEFTRQQQKLLDQLDTVINDRLPRAQKALAEYKNDLANRKSEISTSRYTAQANLMSAPLKRLKYIKDNPAEKDILNAEEKIKDAKADDEASIKRFEDKIASLQDEIKDLQTEGSWYSNHAKEELEDAKNRLAQQIIDKEKIKAGTFNEGVDRWDITVTSGTKLRDLLRNAPEDFEDEYAFAEFAEKFVDAYDDCLDEIIRIGKEAEDSTLVEVFSDFKSDFHEDYLVAELDTDWVNFWLNEFYDLCDNFKVFINL